MKTAIQVFSIASLFFLFGFDWPERVEQQPRPELPLPDFTPHKAYFPANTPGVLTTDIQVKKADFVYFEVSGQVYLGKTATQADARGLQSPVLQFFNRDLYAEKSSRITTNPQSAVNKPHNLSNKPHGALCCINGSEFVSYSKYDRHLKAWGAEWCGDNITDINKIICNAFIAEKDMPLAFVLNDGHPNNNKGIFTITVIVVPADVHRSRNKYNKCPTHPPRITKELFADCGPNRYKAIDDKELLWEYTWKEFYFHGGGSKNLWSYDTFRGRSQSLLGCQCTYKKNGDLDDPASEYVGTFDYAFALYDPKVLGINRLNWRHVILDVWPHDLNPEMEKQTSEKFTYDPIPPENIY